MINSKHLRPYMTCAICRRHVIEKADLVFAVLSELDLYLGYTQPFLVPARGPSFDECTIYIKSEIHSWRICRMPKCGTCSKSPDAFLCHLDCTELISTHIYGCDKDAVWKRIPSIICENALFLNPWPRARGDYSLSLMSKTTSRPAQPKPKRIFNTLGLPHSMLVKQILCLPLELLQIVEAFSAESILWRLLAALEWPEDFAANETQTRQLKDVGLWRRSSLFGEKSTASFVILGIDELGIKEIRFFEKHPTDANMTSMWYALLETASLSTAKVKLKNGYLCLSERPSSITLWDTPNIPNPARYYMVGPEQHSCRLRTISLQSSLTGLTFFVFNGLAYAVHVHYDGQASSALETYLRLPPKLQERIVWIFVPLKGLPAERKIEALWLRHREICNALPEWTLPSLVIRTGKGRNYTIGLHCNQEQALHQFIFEDLGGGIITHLIYSDPDLGEPILKFGACASERRRLRPPRNMPEFPNSSLQEQVYYSHASLNKVRYTRVFYERGSGYCRGVMLQYQDGDEQVLGQCRDDLPQSNCISPFSFSYKTVGDYVQVQFHSRCNEDKLPYALGYKVLCMEGTVRWWFDVEYDYIITIGSSPLSI